MRNSLSVLLVLNTENSDGSVSGGPMYYLSRGLAKRGEGLGKVGKVLALYLPWLVLVVPLVEETWFKLTKPLNSLSVGGTALS